MLLSFLLSLAFLPSSVLGYCTFPCAQSAVDCGLDVVCINSCLDDCANIRTIPGLASCQTCILSSSSCPGINIHKFNCLMKGQTFGRCFCADFVASCHVSSDNDLDQGGVCAASPAAIGLIVTAVLLCILSLLFCAWRYKWCLRNNYSHLSPSASNDGSFDSVTTIKTEPQNPLLNPLLTSTATVVSPTTRRNSDNNYQTLADFLRVNNLDSIFSVLRGNGIDLETLQSMNDVDLQNLGLTIGVNIRLKKALSPLKRTE
jgi:hypothetical protein